MGTSSGQQAPNLAPTVEALRRQLEEDHKHSLTQREQIEAAHEEWARDMEHLDDEYQAMLDADPDLRQRLQSRDAVLDALLDAVAEDRSER